MQLESRACNACSAQVCSGDKFCQHCGTKLVAQIVPEPVSLPAAPAISAAALPENSLELPAAEIAGINVVSLEEPLALSVPASCPDIPDPVFAPLRVCLPQNEQPPMRAFISPESCDVPEIAPNSCFPAIAQNAASTSDRKVQLPLAKPERILLRNGELVLVESVEPDSIDPAEQQRLMSLQAALSKFHSQPSTIRINTIPAAKIQKAVAKKVKRGFRLAVAHEVLLVPMMLAFGTGFLSWIHSMHPDIVYLPATVYATRMPDESAAGNVAEYNKLLADYFSRKTTIPEKQQIAQRTVINGDQEPPSYDEWVRANKPVF